MTPERIAELDAAAARFPVSLPWYSCTTIRNGVTGIHGEPHGEPPHQGVAYLADVFGDAATVVEVMNAYPGLRAHIDAQAATIARLEAERVFVLGAGECVTNWGTYGGEPCVFLEPLVGGAGVQGETVPDSEKHGPHVLRNGSVVLVLRGEPVAFLEDIATARAQGNADV